MVDAKPMVNLMPHVPFLSCIEPLSSTPVHVERFSLVGMTLRFLLKYWTQSNHGNQLEVDNPGEDPVTTLDAFEIEALDNAYYQLLVAMYDLQYLPKAKEVQDELTNLVIGTFFLFLMI